MVNPAYVCSSTSSSAEIVPINFNLDFRVAQFKSNGDIFLCMITANCQTVKFYVKGKSIGTDEGYRLTHMPLQTLSVMSMDNIVTLTFPLYVYHL